MQEERERLLTVGDLKTHFFTSRGTVRAVDGIDFHVDTGEAVGIVGESGSGKSMTALSVLRLVSPPGRIVDGSINFRGRDLLQLDDAAMRMVRMSEIAMIFQDAGAYLNPIMTVGEQIAEAIGRRKSKLPADREKVLQALRDVQIAEPERIAASYPHQLSGGMQQRVMIAAVLIRRPPLIIADEPTTALDATVQFQILKLLAELRRSFGLSLILISHDLAVISDVCDRVYIMYAGQVVESGPTRRIFAEPRHPYTRALVDSILDPWAPRDDLVTLEGAPPDMVAPPPACRFHPRCPKVMPVCSEEAPPNKTFPQGGSARCWLHVPATEHAS